MVESDEKIIKETLEANFEDLLIRLINAVQGEKWGPPVTVDLSVGLIQIKLLMDIRDLLKERSSDGATKD